MSKTAKQYSVPATDIFSLFLEANNVSTNLSFTLRDSLFCTSIPAISATRVRPVSFAGSATRYSMIARWRVIIATRITSVLFIRFHHKQRFQRKQLARNPSNFCMSPILYFTRKQKQSLFFSLFLLLLLISSSSHPHLILISSRSHFIFSLSSSSRSHPIPHLLTIQTCRTCAANEVPNKQQSECVPCDAGETARPGRCSDNTQLYFHGVCMSIRAFLCLCGQEQTIPTIIHLSDTAGCV